MAAYLFACTAAAPGRIQSEGHQRHPQRGCRTSWHNEQEAKAVVDLMKMVDCVFPEGTRVVLTPYVAQRVKIEETAPNSKLNGGRWEVKTGDSFQGCEADYVVSGRPCPPYPCTDSSWSDTSANKPGVEPSVGDIE